MDQTPFLALLLRLVAAALVLPIIKQARRVALVAAALFQGLRVRAAAEPLDKEIAAEAMLPVPITAVAVVAVPLLLALTEPPQRVATVEPELHLPLPALLSLMLVAVAAPALVARLLAVVEPAEAETQMSAQPEVTDLPTLAAAVVVERS